MNEAGQVVQGTRRSSGRDAFLRWAAPMVIGWVVVCLGVAGAHGFASPDLMAFGYLSPVCAALYVIGMHVFLSQASVGDKILSSALIFLMIIPATCVLTHMVPHIVIPILVIISLSIALGAQIEWIAGVFIILMSVSAFGFVYLLFLAALERLVTGATAGFKHFPGLVMTAALSFGFFIEFGDPGATSAFRLGLLLTLPVVHLVILWGLWLKDREMRPSRFTTRRGLVWTAGLAATLYTVAALRFLPAYGWDAVLWPQVVGDHEIRSVVVERIGANDAGELAGQLETSSLVCRIDRILSAATASEWTVSQGFDGASPVCARLPQ